MAPSLFSYRTMQWTGCPNDSVAPQALSTFWLAGNFSTTCSFLLPALSTQLIHDPLGYQAAGDHARGHPCAGMRAGSHEVQILVARMTV